MDTEVVFGARSQFAVECSVRNKVDSFVYCEIGLWIGGVLISDPAEIVTLGVAAHSTSVFLKFRGARQLPADVTTGEEVRNWTEWLAREEQLFIVVGHQIRQRHFLHEVFDDIAAGCMAVVADVGANQKVFWWRQDETVNEVKLPAQYCDATLSQFAAWADDLTLNA